MAQRENFIVYDIETTGLKPGIHGICEIALIAVNSVTLEEMGRNESIVAPYKVYGGLNEEGKKILKEYEIDQVALNVNGLTVEKIAAGKPYKDVVADIIAFSKEHMAGNKKNILVGHNINYFDNPHLENMFLAAGKDLWAIFSKLYTVDTQLESYKMFPDCTGSGEHTLAKLCERFGVHKFDAHSAMPDTVANKDVFVKILKKQRGETISMGDIERDRPRAKFNF